MTDNARAEGVADVTDTTTQREDGWSIPNGTVLIYDRGQQESWLVEVEHSSIPDRYGVHFIQFPERGHRAGGSAWAYGPEVLRPPRDVREHLMLQVFQTAKRVHDLKAELLEAEADAAAALRVVSVMGLVLRG